MEPIYFIAAIFSAIYEGNILMPFSSRIVKHIDKDISTSINYIYGCPSHKFVMGELKAKFLPFLFYKTKLSEKIFNSLSYQIDENECNIIFSKKEDYAYLIFEYFALFSERYNYELYDYCESKLCKKTKERNFMYNCVSKVHSFIQAYGKAWYNDYKNHHKYICNRLSNGNIEVRVLRKLFTKKQFDKYTLDINHITENISTIYTDITKELSLESYWNKNVDLDIESLKYYIYLLIREVKKRYKEQC